MKTTLSILALLVSLFLSVSAFAAPPALAIPDETTTVIVPEPPADNSTAVLEWRVTSALPITDAVSLRNLNWPFYSGNIGPANLPVEVEQLAPESYALRIRVYIHTYYRWEGMWFAPLATRTTQNWFLKVTNADGILLTNEMGVLVLPLELGTRFQLGIAP